jgi:predicted nucleotide-binding protein
MNKALIEQLKKLCEEGEKISSYEELRPWSFKASSFLKAGVGTGEAKEFSALMTSNSWEEHAMRLGHLQGLIAKAAADEPNTTTISASSSQTPKSSQNLAPPESRKVFVVHGHDNEAKESMARFLDKLGLQPVVLHEQASSGRTIIEKFETYASDIAFAVVLLTPDDVGAVSSESTRLKPRARQNVVLELGYFMGKLGRMRVCALYKGGVELPSDYQGVLYIEMDSAGAWRAKLAQEFVQAKLAIELSALLGG